MNEIAEVWGQAMVRCLWQGAIAGALVWLACRVFPRIPNTIRCWLWWLVCLRMLIALAPTGIPVAILPVPAPAPHAESFTFPVPAAPVTALPESLAPVLWTLCTYLFLGWLIGVALLGGLTAYQLARTYVLARRAKPCSDPALLQEAKEIARCLGLKTCPRICITEPPLDTLALAGFRPTVLLSKRVLEGCSPEERRLILAHEFAHLKRGDGWLALLPQAVRIAFFFHPVAWLASGEFDLAREAACDQTAIQSIRVPSDRYGRLLLKLGVRADRELSLCSPGVSSHFRLLRRRISMLEKLSDRPPLRPRRGAVTLAALAALVCAAPICLVQAQIPEVSSVPLLKVKDAKGHLVVTAKQATKVAERKPAATKLANAVKGQPVPDSDKSLEVFHLQSAKTGTVLTLLQHLFSSKDAAFAPDANANLIIARGPKAILNQVREVIQNLDHPPAVAPKEEAIRTTQIYHLQFSEATETSRILKETLGRVIPTLAVDSRTNSIIVNGSEDQLRKVSELLQEIDRPTPQADNESEKVVVVLPLRYAPAESLSKTISAMSKDKGLVAVSFDAYTNSLVIQATKAKIREITDVVKSLDVKH